jgi:5-methylcytosine-specific restriction enzyme A
MPKLRSLKPLLRTADTRTARPPPPSNDPHYGTAEHRAWARAVLEHAGHRCEYVDAYGMRCSKARPQDWLVADHRVELRDGGASLDPCNGWALCSEHHTKKTNQARAERWK